jgi:glycosyltransferase involved in cell wall biosynthesis
MDGFETIQYRTMNKVKIANVVLNNFTNDNRVLKISESLAADGFDVHVVGLLKGSVAEREELRKLKIHRIRLKTMSWPENTFGRLVKFIEFTWRAIHAYRRFDVWHCNDTEAFAIGIAAKITRPKLQLVYDCHEFEAERNGKPRWMLRLVYAFERIFIHWASDVITVSPSIVAAYQSRYKLDTVQLIRNAPHRKACVEKSDRFRVSFGIPSDQRIFLYQGAFVSNRGLEQTLLAFERLPDVHLVCMGYGHLEALVTEAAAKHANIHFQPAVPYHEVLAYTASADVGLLSVQPSCLSYLYCLPNKLFEYIQAGIPILANRLTDCEALIAEYHIGTTIASFEPDLLVQAIQEMSASDLAPFRRGLQRAANDFNWEVEELTLFDLYRKFKK